VQVLRPLCMPIIGKFILSLLGNWAASCCPSLSKCKPTKSLLHNQKLYINKVMILCRMGNSTVLTLVAFAVECYLTFSSTFKTRAFNKVNRSIGILALIWIIAIVSALPILFIGPQLTIVYLNESEPSKSDCPIPNSLSCDIFNELQDGLIDPFFIYVSLSTVVFFILPMILMCILYNRIGIRIRRSRFTSQDSSESGSCNVDASRNDSMSQTNFIRLLGKLLLRYYTYLIKILHHLFTILLNVSGDCCCILYLLGSFPLFPIYGESEE